MPDKQYEYRFHNGKVYELQPLNIERFLDMHMTLHARGIELRADKPTKKTPAEAIADKIAEDEYALLRCVAIVLLPRGQYNVEMISEFTVDIAMELRPEKWKQVIIDTFTAFMNMGFIIHSGEYIGVIADEIGRNPAVTREELIALFNEDGAPRLHRVK